MMAVLTVFIGVVFLLKFTLNEKDAVANELYDQLRVAGLILTIASMILGRLVYTRALNKIQEQKEASLFDKLSSYRQAHIVHLAILDFAGLTLTVFFFLTFNIYFPLLTIAILFGMIRLYPGVEKAINEMELSIEEREKLRSDEVITA